MASKGAQDKLTHSGIYGISETVATVEKFTGIDIDVYKRQVLKKEEGGRHTPFFNGYRPQFYFRTTDVTGDLKLPEEMCIRDR